MSLSGLGDYITYLGGFSQQKEWDKMKGLNLCGSPAIYTRCLIYIDGDEP